MKSIATTRCLNSTPHVLRSLRRRPPLFLRRPEPQRRALRLPTAPLSQARRPTPSNGVLQRVRWESTSTGERPLTSRQEDDGGKKLSAEEIAARKAEQPSYQLSFTCRKCLTRSSHHVTKQAYHFGTTLITCPGCKNRHLISDHLKIFSDKGVTIEDILKEKGELLRKGRLGDDGDVEFYDDAATETVKSREK